MDQPEFGFGAQGQEAKGEAEHSHELYLVSWDGRTLHVHGLQGVTSYDVGHNHHYAGTTAPARNVPQHVHAFYTVTTFNDGHSHEIRGVTGPAVPLLDGRHFHYFEGFTTVNGKIPHSHHYSGRTSDSIVP